jgi:hypothetical protein
VGEFLQALLELVLELDRMDVVSLFKVYKVFVELFGFDVQVALTYRVTRKESRGMSRRLFMQTMKKTAETRLLSRTLVSLKRCRVSCVSLSTSCFWYYDYRLTPGMRKGWSHSSMIS